MSLPEAKPTAVSKVFGVVELLEQILFQAVEVSVPAISSLETVHDPARREHARCMRWILTSAMRVNRAWCSTIKTSPAIQVAMFNNPDCKKQNGREIRFNSLLLEVFPECFKTQDLTKKIPCLKARHDRAVARSDASWRAMFPVLPQMHSIRVSKTEYGGYYNYDDIGVVNSVNLPHTTNRFDMFALYSLVHGIWISAPCRQYTIRYHTFCDPDGKNPMAVLTPIPNNSSAPHILSQEEQIVVHIHYDGPRYLAKDEYFRWSEPHEMELSPMMRSIDWISSDTWR